MPTQAEMTPSEQHFLYYGEKAQVPSELAFYILNFPDLVETINLDLIQNNPIFTRSVLLSAAANAKWLENDMQINSGGLIENAAAAWTLLDNFGAVDLSKEGADVEILPVADELAQRQGIAVEAAKNGAVETRKKAYEVYSVIAQAQNYLLKKLAELEEKKERIELAHKKMQAQTTKEGAKHVTTTETFIETTRKKSEENPKELKLVKKTLNKVDGLLKKIEVLISNTHAVSGLSSTVTVATTA